MQHLNANSYTHTYTYSSESVCMMISEIMAIPQPYNHNQSRKPYWLNFWNNIEWKEIFWTIYRISIQTVQTINSHSLRLYSKRNVLCRNYCNFLLLSYQIFYIHIQHHKRLFTFYVYTWRTCVFGWRTVRT